jgi:hypothetical protein
MSLPKGMASRKNRDVRAYDVARENRAWREALVAVLVTVASCHNFASLEASESFRPSRSGGTGGDGGSLEGGSPSEGGDVSSGPPGAGSGGIENGGADDGGASNSAGTRNGRGGGGSGFVGSGVGGNTENGGAGDGGSERGGDSGDGSGGSDDVTASDTFEEYGAVRLLRAGVATCGGTLITNSWVLTADRCVPHKTEPASIIVGLGSDSRQFKQTRRAVEVVRFPGNDGSDAGRVRDLVLIGVHAPFVMNGKVSGHYIAAWPNAAYLPGKHRCLGWDLRPDPRSSTFRLRAARLESVDIDAAGGEDLVWWANTNLTDPLQGNLLTSNDVGMGCFIDGASSPYLLTVHSGSPDYRSDGAKVPNEEAYSVAVTGIAVQRWLEAALYWTQPTPNWSPDGAVAICSFGHDSLDLFSVRGDGQVGWWRQSAWPGADTAEFREEMPLPPPTSSGVPLSRYDRLGVYCPPIGQIELFARDVLDAVWWQRYQPELGQWADDWERIPDAVATSGLSVVGVSTDRFHLFTRGADGELLHSRYDRGWTSIAVDKDGFIDSAPTACLQNQAWINVVARTGNNTYLWAHFYGAESWQYWWETSTDPASTCWDTRFDVFYRRQSGEIGRYWGDSGVQTDVGTGLTPPSGSLVTIARERGTVDLIVSEPGAPIWHAVWPRDPKSGDAGVAE